MSKLSDLMKKAAVPMPASDAPRKGSGVFVQRGKAVPNSRDLDRILAIPRRAPLDLSSARAQAMADLVTERYSNGRPAGSGCLCHEIDPRRFLNGAVGCITSMLPIQAWTLYEMGLAGGAIGSITVGGGKCHKSAEYFDYSANARRSITDVREPCVSVASFDKTLKVMPAVAFPSGSKTCVKVTLADGCGAEPSQDHPYLTHRGWVHAKDLRPGSDFVAVATQMPKPSTCTVATDAEVALNAYLLSDGGCSNTNLGFTNATPVVVEDFRSVSSELGYVVNESTSKSKARQFRLVGNRERYTEGDSRMFHPDPFRERWGLKGLSKDKRTHASIWGLPGPQVALFLNRFWACDGHVSKMGLECTLASEGLIDDLRFLCTRLGIRTRKHYKKASYVKEGVRREFDSWRVTLSGSAALKFLQEVGPVLGKEDACAWLLNNLETTERNTNYDLVPVGPPELREICDELGLPTRGQAKPGSRPRTDIRKFFGATPGQYVSREKFVEFCKLWNYTGKYSHLATTDVAWERVVKVEDIGIHPVYDLTVPGTHNFVANGIVVHNTILNILGMFPLGAQKALALIPSNLLGQFWDDYRLLAEHFRVPSVWVEGIKKGVDHAGEPKLYVLPYGLLSRPGRSAYIDDLKPDAIICDEIDKLADIRGSATARRVLRYYVDYPATKFAGWTGSLVDRKISEYTHLIVMALKENAPVPHDPAEVVNWGGALDVTDMPSEMGALRALLRPEDYLIDDEIKAVRRGYYRRLSETLGMITTSENDVEVSDATGSIKGTRVEVVVSEKVAPPIPDIVMRALDSARGYVRPDKMFGSPDDEELESPTEKARAVAEIASGVMNVWKFPPTTPDRKKFLALDKGGVPQENKVIDDWYAVRRAWNKSVRTQVLEGAQHFDSPYLCEMAAARFHGDEPEKPGYPVWDNPVWPDWRNIRKMVKPQAVAIRIHPYIVEDAAKWALQNTGIVWYSVVEFGKWVSEVSGLPMHGGGSKAPARLKAERGDRSIIASVDSHGRGRNGLQFLFKNQLITQIPSSSKRWEQLLGRLIRRGQLSDEVTTWMYLHVPELRDAIDQALRRSEFVTDTLGMNLKLRTGWEAHMEK